MLKNGEKCKICKMSPYCARVRDEFACGSFVRDMMPSDNSGTQPLGEKACSALRTALDFLVSDVCFYMKEAEKHETNIETKNRISLLMDEAERLKKRIINELNV